VLDSSYRKALKLDTTEFATSFDLGKTNLLRKVQRSLLDDIDNRQIRAELYKLNVYREGGFFKAHKDTPRASNMIGSLVVALPAAHQGGALGMYCYFRVSHA
jgi:hypothetical protein